MNAASSPSTGFSLTPRDVIVILFRNKWKIIFFTLVGLGVAAYFYQTMVPPWQSTAKLMVRYVVETSAVTPESSVDGERVRSVGGRGNEGVMGNELEILTSWDLAQEVAAAVGPAAILGDDSATNLLAAAAQVKGNLVPSVSRNSNVLSIDYRHPDRDLVTRVLGEIVNQYLEKHLQTHRSLGSFDQLQRDADQMRGLVRSTREELARELNRLNITSLPEAPALLTQQIARVEDSILELNAEVKLQEARMAALRGVLATSPAATNNVASEPILAPLPPPPTEVIEQYRLAGERLAAYRRRELELSGQFRPENPLVKQVLEDIARTEGVRQELEREYPALLAAAPAPGRVSLAGNPVPAVDWSQEQVNKAGFEARLESYRQHLADLKARQQELASAENLIVELGARLAQRERASEMAETNLDRARAHQALDPSKIPNINILQKPSAPVRDSSERLKFAGGAAAAGLLLGLGPAFLRELVFDQSIRTPMEIETRLQLPMFMSIPLLSDRQPVRLLTNGSGKGKAKGDGDAPARPERAPWEVSHFIRPYSDALRDRLIMYFQLKNIHHKPKLVAVTSCSDGAGTTTLAASLAASLSETGEGKVLLVDMNVSRPEMHPFFRGNLASSLTELFQPGAAPAHGQYDNLYLATGTERNGEVSPLVPSKFYEMLPRMRSSDFDYIIFDMPAVKQTSATVALSGFMDKVLLLIEPGKTNRDAVKRATELMRQQHADVAGVVNRLPASAMKWLQPEIA
jgi:succinoglycan biosynthesis transport protein ExoP